MNSSLKKSRFRESSFDLSFQTKDKVIKYDEHPYYRQLSATGLKGVDFIFMEKDKLVLLELKNYGQYDPKTAYPDAALLTEKLLMKYEDSYKGLRAIFSYFRQRRPHKFIFKTMEKLPPRLQIKHPWFIKSKAFSEGKIIFLLVIGFPKSENPNTKQDYCDQVKRLWKKEVDIPLEIIIEDSKEDFEALNLQILH